MQIAEETPRIGVFDSGIGGLTVLCACMRRLPAARFYYFGDNGHAPYGSRPPQEIKEFAFAALSRFEELGADAAVVACNTATAVCIEALRARFSFPVVGVEPAVKRAAEDCRDALVLATPRTAESGRLRRLIARFPETRFRVLPLPSLAGDIERCLTRGEPFDLEAELPAARTDGVVLGCTHYAFYAREISRFYGAPVYDGAEGTAARLEDVIISGRENHRRFLQNPNKYLTFDGKERQRTSPIFLGKWGKINEFVFYGKRLF